MHPEEPRHARHRPEGLKYTEKSVRAEQLRPRDEVLDFGRIWTVVEVAVLLDGRVSVGFAPSREKTFHPSEPVRITVLAKQRHPWGRLRSWVRCHLPEPRRGREDAPGWGRRTGPIGCRLYRGPDPRRGALVVERKRALRRRERRDIDRKHAIDRRERAALADMRRMEPRSIARKPWSRKTPCGGRRRPGVRRSTRTSARAESGGDDPGGEPEPGESGRRDVAGHVVAGWSA
jgi:hypothetical protein